MLEFADIFLMTFHVGVTFFNMLGWIWKSTRKWHLWLVILTTFSWVVMGLWKGLGYCFLTDWHWDVKRRLGEKDLPNSFIKYVVDHTLSTNSDVGLIDTLTGITFLVIIICTIYFNFINNRLKFKKP
ncbi:MAG: DUF2784 domain-containing protein [Bacteroidota bacterium]